MRRIILLLAFSLILTGCSNLKRFVQETQLVNNLSDDDLKYVQFYIEAPLTLEFKITTSQSEITSDNQIKTELLFYQKNILIDEKTPGITYEVQPNHLGVQFEDDLILGFKVVDDYPAAPYKLYQVNGIDVKDGSQINFRGNTYTIRFGKIVSDGAFSKQEKFVSGTIPTLLYKFSSSMVEKRELEKVKGKLLK